MRIAYLTLDEVNQHVAQSFADQHNVNLDVQACPNGIREREYDAVIYDPDSFPRDHRSANLSAVLTCPLKRTVALHSYDLSTDQLQMLRQRGAIVARRLEAGLFVRLLNAVHAAQQQTVA